MQNSDTASKIEEALANYLSQTGEYISYLEYMEVTSKQLSEKK